jgi:hypothetical protein
MTMFRIILSASAMIALACAVPAAAHPDHKKTEEVRTIKIVKADGSHAGHADHAALAADCGKGRKFESSSTSGDDKNKNVSKMVICSDPGESDAEWAATLRKALAEVEANGDIRGEGKAQIVADLRAEIAKVGK